MLVAVRLRASSRRRNRGMKAVVERLGRKDLALSEPENFDETDC